MPNYNDAQGVADLLSQFDFNIISEGPGDFSTQHRKYTCEFSKLSGDFEAIKESGYDFPNPCAMSAEAVRTVNEKGYETAFNEFWKEFMPDKGYEVPTVSEAAQESREASGKLEQDSHDGQTPEREDERADGDAEH